MSSLAKAAARWHGGSEAAVDAVLTDLRKLNEREPEGAAQEALNLIASNPRALGALVRVIAQALKDGKW